MLALDLQPYSCVVNRGLKKLIDHVEPLYKIPSRTTFSRTIIAESYRGTVAAVTERMRADFQEDVESILFTSDMWTSKSNQNYISLTCHYITYNFEMRSFALYNRSVTESHTACNILEHLQAMMDDRELPPQKVPVYLKEAVCLELATSATAVRKLTLQEWKAVTGLVKALRAIASATKDLSCHKHATVS
ncbi:hypothetical protein MTO96_039146 [Rhipicephalus appendiculatus]